MGLGACAGLRCKARLPKGQEGGAIACGGERGRQEAFSETYGRMGIDTGIYRPGARPLASRFWSEVRRKHPALNPAHRRVCPQSVQTSKIFDFCWILNGRGERI